jgi:hypothetical protein
MGDQQRCVDPAIGDIDEMKAWQARMGGKIDDADEVALCDPRSVSIKRGHRARQQIRLQACLQISLHCGKSARREQSR